MRSVFVVTVVTVVPFRKTARKKGTHTKIDTPMGAEHVLLPSTRQLGFVLGCCEGQGQMALFLSGSYTKRSSICGPKGL